MADDHGPIDRDELLCRVRLEQLLEVLTGPRARRRWRCPDVDHADQHPSVTVTVGADGVQRWRCWSGGHRGTAIDAVMAARRVGAGEAMRWLATNYANLPPVNRPAPPPAPPPGRPAQVLVEYVQRAERLLWTAAGRPQRDWLTSRGVGEQVLRLNRVGADPGRRSLPRPAGFPGGWPAVVYPTLDLVGGITYFQARYLDPPAGRGKYDNPAGRYASNPRLGWMRPAEPPVAGVLVVCEGIPDALVAAQAGFSAVGVLGSSYPDARVADGITASLAGRRPVLCFDGDPPGRAGAARLVQLLTDRHVDTAVVTPPEGMDLTGWAGRGDDWAQLLTAPCAPAVSLERATTPAPETPPPRLGLGLGLSQR